VGAPLGELKKQNRKEEAGLKKREGKYHNFLNPEPHLGAFLAF
jgi:hypothetical protein